MLLPATVGANLWLVAVLLPFVPQPGWLTRSGTGFLPWLAMALGAALALAFGVHKKSLLTLYVGFPLLCLLPELVFRKQPGIIGPPPLPLVATLLVAYLLSASHALSKVEAAGDPAPQSNQPLPSGPTPPRWLRRIRMYRGMVVLAALFPSALLFWALGWPRTRDAFEASFGPHTDEALAAVAAGIGLLWFGLYRAYFLGPLDGHLHHDRDVRQAIEGARRQAKRGRPRPAFYIAVVCALAAMAAVLWQRAQ